jgi:hypothetical protein
MNIAIKLNKYINIEYCNNRRAIFDMTSGFSKLTHPTTHPPVSKMAGKT